MINSSENTVECRSLIRLLERYEVRIPIIQRDYAQGRKNNKAFVVRKRLIEDFLSCISSDNKSLDFNFIYGNTEDDIFYPVDGQQRLTSLYLLHWVLACRTAKIDEFGSLKPFTYATRNSANEFFRLLKKPNNELIELAKGSNFENKIKNYPWYLAEWNHDPTVQSALRFVDELCTKLEKQYDYNEMYERLVRNNVITFHLFEENSDGNAESAAAIKYIRMNARGKELTTFENIKAMLDSFIKKNNLKSNITDDYDKKYIDIFYSMAKLKYPNAKLKSVDVQRLNSFIDEKSLAFFKNVHNIARSILRYDTKVYKDFEYLNKLYEDSQKNDLDSKFYEFYFDLINNILHHCQNAKTRDMIKCLFDESFYITENRKETAFALYMYHIGLCEDDISEWLEIFSYILDNLNYINWQESNYLVSNEFIKQISYIKCPILFFSDVTENIFEIDRMVDVLDDIKVRIREQHIKARIITSYQKDFRFFEQLEKRFEKRKIQYLLYISDLWIWNDTNISEKNVDSLIKYMKISYTYFHENEIQWRKKFLVAGCSDENRLLSCDEINRINWQARCEWSDDYYYWDDVNLPNSDKLAILKLAYDSESYKYYDSEQKLKSIEYSNCWLRYAIIRDHIQLLKNKVYFNGEKNRVYIKSDGWNYPKERDFMAQVLVLDYIKNGYLEQNKSVDPTEYYSICKYGVFLLEKIMIKTKTFWANTKYSHSTKGYSVYDLKNYNLTLYGVSRLNIEEPNNDIILSFFNYEKQQLTLLSPLDCNNFERNVYELREGINYLVKTAEEFNNEYINLDYDRLLEIRYGDTEWIHDGGNSRSWRILKPCNLSKPNETTTYVLE